MEKPKDTDFRQCENGTLAYCFALEKYIEHLEKQVKNNVDLHNVVGQSEQLKAFVNWQNDNYPENYIPNSRIGKYNKSL